MKEVFKMGAAMKAAEVMATGEVINNMINQASSRAEHVADFLEEIDKSILEEDEFNA